MLTIRYPLLFAGCGDGICMPFRGERCYVRQCPECSEENLKNIVGDYYYGKEIYEKYKESCIASGDCYNISYCFYPSKKDWDKILIGKVEERTTFIS